MSGTGLGWVSGVEDRSAVPRAKAPPTLARVALISLAMLLLLAGLVRLGVWQIARDGERNAGWQVAQLDHALPILGADALALGGEDHLWRLITVEAVYFGDPMLVSGASQAQVPGYRLMQKARVVGAGEVLIDRGFIAHEGTALALEALAASGAETTVRGRILRVKGSPDEVAFPKRRGGATVWPPRSQPSMTDDTVYIRTGAGPIAYDWTSVFCAVQWFGMALIVLGVWTSWLWRIRTGGTPWTGPHSWG